MAGYVTSYAGLFSPHDADAPAVTSVEIPLIQRDYAQGRTESGVAEIRERFLDVLCEALAGNEMVGLDFVYGDVEEGTLHLLDGQQRLTTLFLTFFAIHFNVFDNTLGRTLVGNLSAIGFSQIPGGEILFWAYQILAVGFDLLLKAAHRSLSYE